MDYTAVCLALLREYRYVQHAYRLNDLPLAHFKISAMSAAWGQFDPHTQVITLSEQLLLEHPWWVVLEVFKHEIVHQVVCWRFPDAKAHGVEFMEMAARLGLASWARQSCVDLRSAYQTWTVCHLQGRGAPGIQRLEKLLALTTSSNEFEAANARARAQEHLQKMQHHHQSMVASEAFEPMTIRLSQQRGSLVESKLLGMIANYFQLHMVWLTMIDVHTAAPYRAVEWLGKPSHLRLAEYCWTVLWRTLEQRWLEHQKMGKRQKFKTNKKSFLLGMCMGLQRSVFYAHNAPSQRQALIASNRGLKALQDYHRRRYPYLSHRGSRTGAIDASNFAAGQAQGLQVRLRPGVASGSQKRAPGLLRG